MTVAALPTSEIMAEVRRLGAADPAEAERWSRAAIAARLAHAEAISRALPSGGVSLDPGVLLGRLVGGGAISARAPTPAARDIDLMAEALRWYAWLEPQARTVVRQRAQRLTWLAIAERARDRRMRLKAPRAAAGGRQSQEERERVGVRLDPRDADDRRRKVLATSHLRQIHAEALDRIAARLWREARRPAA